jgi:hypothetical protein
MSATADPEWVDFNLPMPPQTQETWSYAVPIAPDDWLSRWQEERLKNLEMSPSISQVFRCKELDVIEKAVSGARDP